MYLESLIQETYSLPTVLIASYAMGLLASLTPCIYPMLPITVGIINAQKANSLLTKFLLSLAYGCGIATVYATLGYVSAKSNMMFGQWLANPYFIVLMVAFFIYLAFSMFGFYEMYVPPVLLQNTAPTRAGSVLYSFFFGLFTGAAASPCLTPALALLLGFAAKQQNPAVGFAALFSFAMGLSTLLITVGTFSGAMTLLPRAGAWMEEVKKVFGFLLLGVCVSFLEPLLSDEQSKMLYIATVGAAAIYYMMRLFSRRETR